ncbi:MAG: EAL domain-containing protein [Hyphomicrobium sp.]
MKASTTNRQNRNPQNDGAAGLDADAPSAKDGGNGRRERIEPVLRADRDAVGAHEQHSAGTHALPHALNVGPALAMPAASAKRNADATAAIGGKSSLGAPPDAPAVMGAASAQAAEISHTRERIVFAMMALVTAAFAGMLNVQFQTSVSTAVLAGGVLWAVFMTTHTQLKKAHEIRQLKADVQRLEDELKSSQGPRELGSTVGTHMGSQGGAQQAGTQQNGLRPDRAPPHAATSASSTNSAPKAPSDAASTPRIHGQGASPRAADVPPAPSPADGETTSAPDHIAPEARWETAMPRAKSTLAIPGNVGPGAAAGTATPPHSSAAQPPPYLQQARSAGPAPTASNSSSNDRQHGALRPQPYAETHDGAAAAAPPPLTVDAPLWPGTSVSASDPMRDAWAFRPRTSGGLSEAPAPGGSAPQLSIEAEVELVGRKIKALAEEVNAAEAMRARRTQAPSVSPAPAIEDSISALRSAAGHMRQPGFADLPAYNQRSATPSIEPAIGTSMAPLTAPRAARADGVPSMPPLPPSAEPSLHAPSTAQLPSLDSLIPASAQPIAVSPQTPTAVAADVAVPPQAIDLSQLTITADAPVAPSGLTDLERQPSRDEQGLALDALLGRATADNERPLAVTPANAIEPHIAAISEAIQRRRMDVLLCPIVGLGDYSVRHYEVMVRLKSESGEAMDSGLLEITPADIMTLFDVERLSRTAELADRLSARGKSGSVLSAIAGPSMADARFLETFAQIYEGRNTISSQLVLTFRQADVERFSDGAWQALDDMHAFGFRFAIDDITHLGTDFTSLARSGFAFIKLPARAFLDGLPADQGVVAPHAICKHLAGSGLTLVVESIDDDAALARIFGFGVLFGQGQLFGGARAVALDGDGRGSPRPATA